MYKSGFFNSMNGDRKYNAEDMSNFYGQLISNGILSKSEDSLQVTAGDGLTVSIAKGWAWINSHWYYSDSSVTLNIPTVGATETTYSVVLRLYDSEQEDSRKIVPEVIEGTVPKREPFIYDLVLATVRVQSNATSIYNYDIVDTRADTQLCGWVTGLIEQVDTTTLFNQWQSAYQHFYDEFVSWYNSLADTLGISTYIDRLEYYATSTEGQTVIIPEFEKYSRNGGDIIDVYINGIRLIPNVEYTTSGDGVSLKITLNSSLMADNGISVTVTKSELGVYGGSGSTDANYNVNSAYNIVAIDSVTQTEL